jgi:hypothetical protein
MYLNVATVLGSIPESADTVESEGSRQGGLEYKENGIKDIAPRKDFWNNDKDSPHP